MYVQLNSVIVDADTANRQELATFLGQFGINPVAQLGSVEGLAAMLGRGDAPQLVIVNLDPNAHENLKHVGKLPREFPNVSFFLMSHVLDANLLMEAMHLGVKEFIPLPIAEEKFTAAIERVATSHGMGKRAKIIHVIPTIGGGGAAAGRGQVGARPPHTGET